MPAARAGGFDPRTQYPPTSHVPTRSEPTQPVEAGAADAKFDRSTSDGPACLIGAPNRPPKKGWRLTSTSFTHSGHIRIG